MMLAHVVPFKGGGVEWLVGQLLRDLRKMGCRRKSNSQERPSERHIGCSQRCLETEGKNSDSTVTLVESCPKGESRSNGIAERTVQDLEGVRTHKLDLETKLKMAVGIGSSFALRGLWKTWLTSSTSFKIGHDGRTAYERLKGKT